MTSALHRPLSSAAPQSLKTSSDAALEIYCLNHSYGARKALEDVTIRIETSTFTVLLGLNGAGKSTLFSLITRLFNAQRGEIRIFGHDLRRQPGEALKLLGVVFQARTLDLDLSVQQNLLYHAALHGMTGREARARAGDVLRQVALDGRSREKARNLSGGQIRRVEIARALLHKPRIFCSMNPRWGSTSKRGRTSFNMSGPSLPRRGSAFYGPLT